MPDLDDFFGQPRATQAIDLGVRIKHPGYNIFAHGPTGTGKMSLVRMHIEDRARNEPPPDDWCYVNNFDEPTRPRALRLPAGVGRQLRTDVQRFRDELGTALASTLVSEDVQTRRQQVSDEVQSLQQQALKDLQEKAEAQSLTIVRTDSGFAFAPVKDGQIVPPEDFEKLTEEEQQEYRSRIDTMQTDAQKFLFKVPAWERELSARMRALNTEIAEQAIRPLIGELVEHYQPYADVIAWLEAARRDIVENAPGWIAGGEKPDESGGPARPPLNSSYVPRRYDVNIIVDSSGATGAPVVFSSNPTYLNLVGRVEHLAQMGALTTDYTLIRAGDLHRANGGYLVLDAQKVITSPNSWEGLKRALQSGEIRIESPLELLSLTSTVTLEPEPIPLRVKVVLLGETNVYYLVSTYDPDFGELFKISADFDDEIDRTTENEQQYVRLMASIARGDQLRPFDRSAAARLIDVSARLADDADRLSSHMSELRGIMQEADYWTNEAGATVVTAEHVDAAMQSRVYRLNRVEERLREEILRDSILIDTEGDRTGQVNGLSVMQLGKHSFGQAARITATIRLGSGDVVDIEREVDMGGPIHSKGVLILSSYLRTRYAAEEPMSLTACLVFEQNYGGVEGDSAATAELCALLSAIANVPIHQSLAVTGSVNQLGEVQAVGGVNEKIEGYFDLCQARGFTGNQGVVIPASNVQHLMLREDVVEAATRGEFSIFAVRKVDEAIEILTGLPAGELQADGKYPEGSFNRHVVDALARLGEARKRADNEVSEESEQTEAPRSRARRKKKPEVTVIEDDAEA